jgi:hypothetical protein
MLAPTLSLLLALAAPADTGALTTTPAADTVPVAVLAPASDTPAAPLATPSAILAGPLELPPALRFDDDTVPRRRRAKAIEVSDWYERRLRIHRYGAYAMIPLFAFQSVAGNQLYQEGSGAPGWAKTGHRWGAAGLATVFGVNTVTGLWNLWDSRAVPQGRTRRTIHTLLMLASDAGFTYAGVRLSEQAENSADVRRQHRAWAYGSMATAIAGSGLMVLWRD